MKILSSLLAAALACCTPAAGAQAYPSKPIRLIVAFPPGGNIDITARILAASLTEQFAQPVIVDNRAGADGVIGGSIVAKSAPDGYTLLMASSGSVTTPPAPNADIPYDFIRDFAAISIVQAGPYVLVSTLRTPVAKLNLRELMAFAKEHPGQLTMAYSGLGTRLVLESMNTMAGVKFLPVPYKGGAPAMTGLMGGEVDTMITQLGGATGAMRDGRVKGLAITALKRSTVAPEIPTLDEAGIKGFQASTFVGMFAPAATSRTVINILNAAIVRSITTTGVKEKFRDLGVEPQQTTPEQFRAIIRSDIAKWKKVVQPLNIRMD